MSGKKRKKKLGGRKEYVIKTVCFLAVFLIITVAVVFAAINPITNLVHKIEGYVGIGVRDITLNDSAYEPLSADIGDITFNYGDKIAVISSNDFALDCPVYYGANRISMSQGGGFVTDSALFAQGGTSIVTGYLEGGFSPLEYAEEGDTLTVVTDYGEYNYRIYSVGYYDAGIDEYKTDNGNDLVLCGIPSSFSRHSGEKLYLRCEPIGEGE